MEPALPPWRRPLERFAHFPEEDPELSRLSRRSFGLFYTKPNVPLLSQLPPSIVRISPLINELWGAARNATASATCSGVPQRPAGIIAVMRSTASGESHNCLAAP